MSYCDSSRDSEYCRITYDSEYCNAVTSAAKGGDLEAIKRYKDSTKVKLGAPTNDVSIPRYVTNIIVIDEKPSAEYMVDQDTLIIRPTCEGILHTLHDEKKTELNDGMRFSVCFAFAGYGWKEYQDDKSCIIIRNDEIEVITPYGNRTYYKLCSCYNQMSNGERVYLEVVIDQFEKIKHKMVESWNKMFNKIVGV
jgi:hypothetical protein